MVVDLKEFLSRAPRITIPTQYNVPVITDVDQNLQFVYDVSEQGRRIQRGEVSHTLVGAASPVFKFPSVPTDEIHTYHFLAVFNDTTPGIREYQLLVQYPQFAREQEERYQVDTAESFNLLSLASGGNGRAERAGRPYTVFPEGIFTVCRNGSATIGDTVTLSFLREVVGGAAVVELVSNIVVSSEK